MNLGHFRYMMQPELICDYRCEIGENPLWHASEKRVYWCDSPTGRMFRYDPGSRKHEEFYRGEIVGGFTVQADGSLLLFMARGAVKLCRTDSIFSLIEEIPEERS